jgi:hypothetical protein
LEIIQQDNKATKPVTVATIGEHSSSSPCEYKDKDIKAINAICTQQWQAHCSALPMEEPRLAPMDIMAPRTTKCNADIARNKATY